MVHASCSAEIKKIQGVVRGMDQNQALPNSPGCTLGRTVNYTLSRHNNE